MTGGRVTADETRSRQKGNVRNSGVIGNRSMLEIVQRAAPAVIQRTVTVGTGGGKKTYDGTGEEHVKKELGLYLPRTKYKKRQAEMLTELSKWLADEAPHSAKTYEDLAANLFEAVLPAPSQTVCDASVPVYEGDFPSIWGIKETMIYEEWLKKIHLKEKCISELKAMEGGKYGEKLKELSDARLKDLKGYVRCPLEGS